MEENGLDWRKSILEAARVLKPGGRFLFCEQTTVGGASYLEYMATVKLDVDGKVFGGEQEDDGTYPMFELVGYDDVDFVIEPHVAGVVIKAEDAGKTEDDLARQELKAEKERIADLSISAYERGLKKRKRKKKKNTNSQPEA